MGPEPLSSGKPDTKVVWIDTDQELQWGRSRLAPENGPRTETSRRVRLASMGPEPLSSGKPGKAAVPPESADGLQWGRSRLAPENLFSHGVISTK